jgi:hypothetical protein
MHQTISTKQHVEIEKKIPVYPHDCIDRNQILLDDKSSYLQQYLKNIVWCKFIFLK